MKTFFSKIWQGIKWLAKKLFSIFKKAVKEEIKEHIENVATGNECDCNFCDGDHDTSE
ncbi:MAG: hypothetical protein IKY67_06765 [Paludibacteraceae bacterium]|nr:hypothetical protein [Paludibacteraceae bacterium]